jgi:hypothetical protein
MWRHEMQLATRCFSNTRQNRRPSVKSSTRNITIKCLTDALRQRSLNTKKAERLIRYYRILRENPTAAPLACDYVVDNDELVGDAYKFRKSEKEEEAKAKATQSPKEEEKDQQVYFKPSTLLLSIDRVQRTRLIIADLLSTI